MRSRNIIIMPTKFRQKCSNMRNGLSIHHNNPKKAHPKLPNPFPTRHRISSIHHRQKLGGKKSQNEKLSQRTLHIPK